MNKPYVLLVEDDVNLCQLYLYVLLTMGCEVRAVLTGAAAFAAVMERKPDLILTDVMMPGMDGIEFIECLREKAEFADLPIIVCSAATPEYLDEALATGATKTLAKPVDPLTLIDEVRRVLPEVLNQ